VRSDDGVRGMIEKTVAEEPPSYSGKQVLDEEVLRELAGITNFDHYWCGGKPPERPVYIDKSLS
jgi:hypothetical protein